MIPGIPLAATNTVLGGVTVSPQTGVCTRMLFVGLHARHL